MDAGTGTETPIGGPTETPEPRQGQRLAKSEGDVPEIQEFDGLTLRRELIQMSGAQLSMIAESSGAAIGEQLKIIDRSQASFEPLSERVEAVRASVSDIDRVVSQVAAESEQTAQDLQAVSERVRSVEHDFAAIDTLLGSINKIADKSNLLALNATIEAARVGELGKGFAVVADEVKQLSATTKQTNSEIRDMVETVGESISSLVASVEVSVETISGSVETIGTAKASASTVATEVTAVSDLVLETTEAFDGLHDSADRLEGESREIKTLGATFKYLVEMMRREGVSENNLDPLERLAPLVGTDGFEDRSRFENMGDEILLTEDDILLSATDTRGFIRFANRAFYEIAGYPPVELIGMPHNVIRHPDMPRTAFADLWATLKDGKLWQGYVVNKTKDGNHYWVLATVFPCYENGELVAYTSLRVKPDRAKVRGAIAAYRLVP